jgi:hypothetical protein
LVKELIKHGYSVKDSCSAIGVSRSRYYNFGNCRKGKESRKTKDGELLNKIKAIKGDHPFWGYRRVTAWLRQREGLLVNRKTVKKSDERK